MPILYHLSCQSNSLAPPCLLMLASLYQCFMPNTIMGRKLLEAKAVQCRVGTVSQLDCPILTDRNFPLLSQHLEGSGSSGRGGGMTCRQKPNEWTCQLGVGRAGISCCNSAPCALSVKVPISRSGAVSYWVVGEQEVSGPSTSAGLGDALCPWSSSGQPSSRRPYLCLDHPLFYWLGIWAQVQWYCTSCMECQLTQPWDPKDLCLQPMPVAPGPFEQVGIDIMGPHSSHLPAPLFLGTDGLCKLLSWGCAAA